MNTTTVILFLMSVLIGALIEKLGVPFWIAFPMFGLLVTALWLMGGVA